MGRVCRGMGRVCQPARIWEGGILGLKMRILVRSPAHLCLFLHCNMSKSRPALRLPTQTSADCGSIKGAGVSAEEGIRLLNNIYGKFKHCQRRNTDHDDSYSYSFSSDGHHFFFLGGGGMAPRLPSGSATADQIENITSLLIGRRHAWNSARQAAQLT